MGEGLQILIFAMIAAFILLRLRSVLGRRTGGEPPHLRPGSGPRDVDGPSAAEEDGEAAAADDGMSETRALIEKLPAVSRDAIREIYKRDRRFNLEHFLDGAQAAYRMILEGFWAGNFDDIRPFVSDEVADQFGGAIAQREQDGLTLENRLLETEETAIVSAAIEGGNAELVVRFESNIVAITRDRGGHVVEGDVTDTVGVSDIWTFSRPMGASDPNWTLVETRAG